MLPELAHHAEKLFYFFEVANTGSYQATARKIGVSAPTLSYSIKQLEEVMNTTLFHRSQKGATLTEAGETLLTFCRRYYRDMEEMQLQLRKKSHRTITRLRVGTFSSIAIYFWPTLIKALGDDPNLSLSIMTDRSKAVQEALIKRAVDVAVTVEDFQHSGIIKHELYRDEYAFYCSSKWRIAQIKQEDVIHYPVLFIPDAIDEDRKTLRQHLLSWGLLFREEFEFDSFEVIGEFVKNGYGIGILPTKAAKTHGKAVRRLRITGLPATLFGAHRFFLSYREDLHISQRVMHSFLTAARKAVRMQVS